MTSVNATNLDQFWEALRALIPLIGAGGLTAIMVAYFGSRRPPPPEVQKSTGAIGIGALLADHFAMERLTGEMKRVADTQEKIANTQEKVANSQSEMAHAIHRFCDIVLQSQIIKRSHER